PTAFALVVDGVFRQLDDEVLVVDLRLAGEARGRLEAPGLVEHVLFLLLRRLERVEALAQYHVARGARRLLLASVLDVDVMFEQVVADRLGRVGLELRAVRAQRRLRQHLDLGHYSEPIFLPASARRMPSSMRRSAKGPAARFSASIACLIGRWSLPATACASVSSAWSIGWRSAGVSNAASAASAERVASSMRSPSTRASASARACTSSLACENESRSMRSMSASARPYDGLTVTDASAPVVLSFAATERRPSAST